MERWFGLLTEKQLRRGVHQSSAELEAAIYRYLDVTNEDPKPFVWTKTADQILGQRLPGEEALRRCNGTPAAWRSAGLPQPGKSRTATPDGGCSDCPGLPVPPRPPGRLHPPASASGGRSPASCAARSLPPAANPPRAHRPRTGSGYSPSGTRSPAAAAVPAGVAAGAGFGQQPGRGLVKADHWPFRVIGFGVEVQHVLHLGHELRAHRGDAPLLLLPRLEGVFLRRLRTPSWDMEGANPNSTTRPASRRRVQWSCPSGGGLQASAMRCASPRSSNFRRRLAWGRSHSAPSNPSPAKRCLTRYTVPSATSKASATRGAAQPSSLLSRIRALAVTRAELPPTRIRL